MMTKFACVRMKKCTEISFILFLMFITLLSSLSYSISLGSFPPDKKVVELSPGSSVKIKIGFFNPGSEDIYISMLLLTRIASSSYGPDLRVYFVDKDGRLVSSFVLPRSQTTTAPTSKKEWYLLSDGKTYVEVKPVYVLIEVPNKPTFAKNHYRLVISARASKLNPQEYHALGGIYQTLAQERQYYIDVIIKGVVPVGEVSMVQEAKMMTMNDTIISNRTIATTLKNQKEDENEKKLGENDKYINPKYYLENKNERRSENSAGTSITGKFGKNVSKINKTTILIVVLGIIGVAYVARM